MDVEDGSPGSDHAFFSNSEVIILLVSWALGNWFAYGVFLYSGAL